jgi:glycosidase
MIDLPAYPSLLHINTRVWLRALSERLGRRATLADVPDDALDRIAGDGFDWVWLLSVWRTGEAGRAVSRSHAEWQEGFRKVLPDLTVDDICGSGFAITGYETSASLGGNAELAHIRRRLADRGLKLMLDFVPNHTAPDHPWVETNPHYFIEGSEDDLANAPQNWLRVETGSGERILAYGRDPYFAGWPDTLQLDYSNPDLAEARVQELLTIAELCDGVRCDMAMLIVPEVFKRTWGISMPPFWPGAIERVLAARPGFTFMAEVYWDMEWELQHQGFDYCYDKRLYDRLLERSARPVREHLVAGLDYQRKLARFLENHDEPRAAASFDPACQRAAAAITYFSPGLRFFYQGQTEGARVHVPPHLCRGPSEPVDEDISEFYSKLLAALRDQTVRDGSWRQIDPEPVSDDNSSFDAFVAFVWDRNDDRRLVVVNFSGASAQCRLRLPYPDLVGRTLRLTDRLGDEVYDRSGDELLSPGLYVDHAPWHATVFTIETAC